MKKIKFLFLTFLVSFVSLLMIFISCNDDSNSESTQKANNSLIEKGTNDFEIGKINPDGNFVITMDILELKKYFSEISKHHDLGVIDYNKFYIKGENYEDSNGKYYFLLGVDENEFIKTAVDLVLEDGVFYVEGGGGTITCSSSQCPGVACTPYKATVSGGTVWTCSPCAKTCNKTATLTIPKGNNQ